MYRITGVSKNHDWGSPTLLPAFLGEDVAGTPWAEQWFGAHPLGPAQLSAPGQTAKGPRADVEPEPDAAVNAQVQITHRADSPSEAVKDRNLDLRALIESDPLSTLGQSTRLMFGDELPYLVKLIAPARALSLQVHPGRSQACTGFTRENTAGIPIGSRRRIYQDPTHKPEMLYAITRFEALVGFAVRRQVRSRLEGLDCSLASRLSLRLRLATGRGIKPVVSWILDDEDGPQPEEVAGFAAACARRLKDGLSPEPEVDATIERLQTQFPGEAGIIMCFLMNHVVVEPGNAVFVPTGTVHSYQHGLGLEVMANSDNVVRAGLTSKHIDRRLFLDTASFDGLPPTRIAPEHPVPGIDLFRSPVEDFELCVASPSTAGASHPLALRGTGPRILVGLDGALRAQTRLGDVSLSRGEAVFVPDFDGPILLSGSGRCAQVSVP